MTAFFSTLDGVLRTPVSIVLMFFVFLVSTNIIFTSLAAMVEQKSTWMNNWFTFYISIIVSFLLIGVIMLCTFPTDIQVNKQDDSLGIFLRILVAIFMIASVISTIMLFKSLAAMVEQKSTCLKNPRFRYFFAIVSFLCFSLAVFSGEASKSRAKAIKIPIQTGYYVPEESASICKLSSEEFSIRDEVLLFDDGDNTMSDSDGVCIAKQVKNTLNDNNEVLSYQIDWQCDGLGEKDDQSMIVNVYKTSDKIDINKRNYIRCNR